MAKKRKIGFDEFYADLFQERWEGLRESLAAESGHLELRDGLLRPYFLDAASLLPVDALKPEEGSNFLDLCAAPGGKSLAIASRMPPTARLTANDRSASRRGRLHRVLEEHLPPAAAARISVTGHDAARWGLYEQNLYDRVLADVPCSSERHLVQDPRYLTEWSPARTRHLAIQAFAILAAGFTALAPGGILVYSTCALSSLENDAVAGKLLKRRGAQALLLPLRDDELPSGAERTDHGVIILPDRAGGRGPIYCARFTKAPQ